MKSQKQSAQSMVKTWVIAYCKDQQSSTMASTISSRAWIKHTLTYWQHFGCNKMNKYLKLTIAFAVLTSIGSIFAAQQRVGLKAQTEPITMSKAEKVSHYICGFQHHAELSGGIVTRYKKLEKLPNF